MDPKLGRVVTQDEGLHPQSQVTLRYRVHVTNQKRYIATFTRPVDPKLSRVVTWDDETPRKKSSDTSIK